MYSSDVDSSLSQLVNNIVAYNVWANRKYVNWLNQKGPELLHNEVPSSFSSLKDTLIHIWDTERFWLSVLQQVPHPNTFRNRFEGTLEDVFVGIVSHSENFAQYVSSLSDEELMETVTLVTPWASGTRPRFQFIQHCMNHSTYHRGQIVTIGRNLGITDAPMTDYNFYLTMPEN